MKQRITINQISELSDKQKVVLREWFNPSFGDMIYDEHYNMTGVIKLVETFDGCQIMHIAWENDTESDFQYLMTTYPLLSIGQMFDILHARNQSFGNHYINFDWDGELCDALWDEVKQIQ